MIVQLRAAQTVMIDLLVIDRLNRKKYFSYRYLSNGFYWMFAGMFRDQSIMNFLYNFKFANCRSRARMRC